MDVTVKVSNSTRASLKLFKASHQLKSVDSVILFLLDHFDKTKDAAPRHADPAAAPEPKEGKRQINVCEGLFSYEAIQKRRGMLEYYTGHDRGEVDLIITAFDEVRAAALFPLLPLGQP